MQEESVTTRSISLPPSLIEAVDRLARQDNRKFSNYVRILLEEHVSTISAKQAAKEAKKAAQVAA